MIQRIYSRVGHCLGPFVNGKVLRGASKSIVSSFPVLLHHDIFGALLLLANPFHQVVVHCSERLVLLQLVLPFLNEDAVFDNYSKNFNDEILILT